MRILIIAVLFLSSSLSLLADVTLRTSSTHGLPGDTVQIDVSVDGFYNILAFYGSINYDPTILEFVSVSNFGLPGLNENVMGLPGSGTNAGIISYAWTDPTLYGLTLIGENVIFSIFLKVIGEEGQQSFIEFSNTPTTVQIIDENTNLLNYEIENGFVCVSATPDCLTSNNTEECDEIDIQVNNIIADFGTSLDDSSDDTFYADIFVSGNHNCGWTGNDVDQSSGFLNEWITVGPFLISEGDVSFEITPNGYSNCSETIIITAPLNAAPLCDIVVQILDTYQDDNGTPMTGIDDSWSTDLLILIGDNNNQTWSAKDQYGNTYNGSSGQQVTFGPYPITQDLTLTIEDNLYGAECSEAIQINSPGYENSQPILTAEKEGPNGDRCIDIRAAGFTEVNSFSFDAYWGYNLGSDISIQSNYLTTDDYTLSATDMSVNWTSDGTPFNLSDDEILLSICFNDTDINCGDILLNNGTFDSNTPSYLLAFKDGNLTTTPASISVPSVQICESEQVQLSIPSQYLTNYDEIKWTPSTGLSCDDCPTPVLTPVESVTYSLFLSSSDSCDIYLDYEIEVIAPFEIDYTVEHVNCDGSNLGSIDIEVPGNAINYSYLWSNGISNPDINGLSPGIYSLTVTNELGCNQTLEVEVLQKSLSVQVEEIIPESCDGAADGQISVDVNGGSENYEFAWSNGSTFPYTVNDLISAFYGLTVTDQDLNCETSIPLVDLPQGLIIGLSNDTVICAGSCMQLFVDAPNADSYNWNSVVPLSCDTCPSPVLLETFDSDNYLLTVQTDEGCEEQVEVYVDVRNYLDFGLLPFSNGPICEGEELILDAHVINAQHYTWTFPDGNVNSDGPILTIPNATPAMSGTYSIDIIDDIGCETGASFDVEVIPALSLDIQLTEYPCNTECDAELTLFVNGGTAPYTFLWSNGVTEVVNSELCSGTYFVTVMDASGACEAVASGEVPIPVLPEWPLLEVIQADCEGDVAKLIITPPSDADILLYYCDSDDPQPIPGYLDWEMFRDSCGELFFVDENGCSFTVPIPDIDVIEPNPIVITINEVIPSECDQPTGSISLDVSGGSPPYIFQWSDPSINTNGTIEDLYAGLYQVSVTDVNNCTQEITVEVPDNDIVSISASTEICEGQTTQLSANIPTDDIVAISWQPTTGLNDPTSPAPLASPSETTTYTVYVTDSGGCISTASTTVYVLPEACIFSESVTIQVGETGFWCDMTAGPLGFEVTQILCEPNNGHISYDAGILPASCMSYTGESVGQDTLCFEVCQPGGTFCLEYQFYITVENSWVWPGDTDTNGIVNNFDILNIGLGIDSMGPIRPNATINWSGQPGPDWVQQTTLGLVNYKHIDTDGNGVIEEIDTNAIVLNWGETYNFAPQEETENLNPDLDPVPFFLKPDTLIEGQTFNLPIILGEMDHPAEDVYGLAFSLEYDPDLIEDGTARVVLNDSWLGDLNADMIFIQKNFDSEGRMDVGITRIDGQNMDGFGAIGVFNITIEDDILLWGGNEEQRMNNLQAIFKISNVRIISFQEEELNVFTNPTEAEVVTSTNEITLKNSLKIYPNPTTDLLYINSAAQTLDMVSLRDWNGKLLKQQFPQQLHTQMTTNELPAGVYLLQIQSGDKMTSKRVTIVR